MEDEILLKLRKSHRGRAFKQQVVPEALKLVKHVNLAHFVRNPVFSTTLFRWPKKAESAQIGPRSTPTFLANQSASCSTRGHVSELSMTVLSTSPTQWVEVTHYLLKVVYDCGHAAMA